MRPKEVAFTRTAIRQLAGLAPTARDQIREALSAYAADEHTPVLRVDPSRAPPIVWLGLATGWVAAVTGEDRVVVLRLGVEIDAATHVLRDLATGREERVSEPIAARLLRGENAVKVWREHRRVTQSALAKNAGITMDYLSKLETGRRHASDEVTSDLMRALSVDALDFGFLIEVPGRGKKKRRGR
jgi:DNA-binding XRE family transcriptional regulator